MVFFFHKKETDILIEKCIVKRSMISISTIIIIRGRRNSFFEEIIFVFLIFLRIWYNINDYLDVFNFLNMRKELSNGFKND